MRIYPIQVFCLGVVCFSSMALAQDLPSEPIVCEYPRLPERLPFASLDPTRLAAAVEAEPNSTANTAQVVPLGFAGGQQQDVDIDGQITPFDQDWYSFTANGGDTIGVAVLAIDAANLDSHVSIRGPNGASLLQNDQHGGIASFYPPESQFPAGGTVRDSALTFAIPQTGTYFVHVEGHGASAGGYRAQLRLRQPPLRGTSIGTKQILFLDFNGASGVHADEMFGAGGIHNATLSNLDIFLPGWGIAANRRNALIDKIVANVSTHFAQLLVGTNSQFEILNSKDDQDDFGQPNVSRVIVGGKISELGVSTIGIAEYIDPANYSTDDTAVVLLDLLSAPATNPNSVLSLARAPGMSVEDAVAHVVACVITHEACHFLGCWHTENGNQTASIIDRGGNLPNMAGIGIDGILGTPDDRTPTIHDDNYALEGVGRPQDIQNVRAQVIASLSVGTVTPSDETAAMVAMIAGLEIARQQPDTSAAQASYTPLNTRLLLSLPEVDPSSFQPTWESSGHRLDGVIEKLKTRLETLQNE